MVEVKDIELEISKEKAKISLAKAKIKELDNLTTKKELDEYVGKAFLIKETISFRNDMGIVYKFEKVSYNGNYIYLNFENYNKLRFSNKKEALKWLQDHGSFDEDEARLVNQEFKKIKSKLKSSLDDLRDKLINDVKESNPLFANIFTNKVPNNDFYYWMRNYFIT